MIVASLRAEPAFAFMVVALIIIFGPLVAERLRVPGLIGLLVGGALIGPNMLGVLDDFSGLEAFGDIGVLYLIFLAGLGLDMKTFERYWNVALTFGLITAVIPWALGTGVALLGGYETKTAILIGSFWASFTLVSYGVVTKYGLTRNPSMAAAVGASSITDTIGLLTLALVVGSETGDSRGAVLILQIGLGLVVVAVFSVIVLPVVTRWFFAGLGHERELRFMMVLAGLASAAVVADLVAIEPLIGAFFAGLGLNRLIPNESRLMARVDFFGNALFIPAFLVSVGLLVDPSVMFEGSTLRIAIGLAAALVVGKAAAAWTTGRIYDFSKPEVGLMFSLSTAQAAATLASTIIGYEIGLYSEDIVNAVMVVIVVSLFVSGIGSSYYGPRVEPAVTTERRLGETIVVPVPGDVDITNSMWLGGRMAEVDGGVVIPLGVAVTDEPDARDRSNAVLGELRTKLRSLGLTGDPELRIARSVAGGVDRFAIERDASLVLLTWPGSAGFRRLMLGGANDEIAATTDRPIALAAIADRHPRRVLLVSPRTELTPGLRGDVSMAVGIATRIADAEGIELVVGPASSDELAAAGVELPASTVEVGGADEVNAWIDQHAERTDLLVIPAGDDGAELLDGLSSRGLSAVAAARSWGDQRFASDGALGVATARRPVHARTVNS
ncbi:MAG: cation:proton antiporter [Acidimicrobiales bacterium]